MASDRARISYDQTRRYRSVVAQQGRVTLEADVNEAAAIASEALRLETLDAIGPAGTPDDGYAVAVNSAGTGFTVGAGTLYAGGWRLRLDQPVDLASQPDWIDQPAPPAVTASTTSVVALLAIEQSITAAEDTELREVALGGPDTAARTRLMQHFLEIPTTAGTCSAAAGDLGRALALEGLIFDPKTLELTFDASLKVSFFPPPPPSDPCCPPAQGGYLGSDNQLVRVRVTAYDPATRSGTLIWGWNNASFLYRASLVDPTASPQVLTLSPAPIDAEHTPQPNQLVEVLRTTCVLSGKHSDYIAALEGVVATLGAAAIYDSTSQQLTLPGTPLTGAYTTGKTPLFVRLWQAEVTFTAGKAAQLDQVSGLAVTIDIKALPSAPFDAQPYWRFAVRPNTPQKVYPQSFLDDPQPASGPRQWLCDLALVETAPAVNGGVTATFVADCRVKFLPLTELNACECCELTLNPNEKWQEKLLAAIAAEGVTALNVCFQPGVYSATQKIAFSNLTVKMTGAGAASQIVGPSLEAVFEFDQCPAVTLCDLAVEAGVAGNAYNHSTQGLKNLQGAVTLRDCLQVDIDRVTLTCADADLRSASCLYAINTVAAAGESQPITNVRVTNSQFLVGDCQVGMLLVNVGRVQVEGNVVLTQPTPLNVKASQLSQRLGLANRLEKLLAHEMTIVDSSASARKARKLMVKRQLAAQKKTAAATAAAASAPATGAAPAEPAPAAPAAAEAAAPAAANAEPVKISANVVSANVVSASVAAPAATAKKVVKVAKVAVIPPKVDLGAVGLAHVTATYGTLTLKFLSSNKLTNAWTNALKASGLTETSTIRQVHDAVRKVATAASRGLEVAENAFPNFIQQVLPQLFSTASQGIVVAGNFANDVRILDNTIDGTTQGIHVGLGDGKTNPKQYGLEATQVQIRGNTIVVRVTPGASGGRHGIFVGGVESLVVRDNNLTLIRTEEGSYDTDAIRVIGVMGPRILLVGNSMNGTFTQGIYVQPAKNQVVQEPADQLWKAADNQSSAHNQLPGFVQVDNYLS